MFDPPITTTATIIDSPKPEVYQVSLPNGKVVIGHVPKAKRDLHPSLQPDTKVTVELTPYDLDKARIVEICE